MTIHFFDCPNCGKSLRVGARACHHCHAVDENDWADPDAAAEFANGGYNADDEADTTGSFASSKIWRRIVVLVAFLLLLAFTLELVLPMFGSRRRATIVR